MYVRANSMRPMWIRRAAITRGTNPPEPGKKAATDQGSGGAMRGFPRGITWADALVPHADCDEGVGSGHACIVRADDRGFAALRAVSCGRKEVVGDTVTKQD